MNKNSDKNKHKIKKNNYSINNNEIDISEKVMIIMILNKNDFFRFRSEK